ncbi:hypothetical protein SAMN05660742_11855 [Propionispira arboris]|uniref:SLH domain-containing protein n=1 Tax=Propionispira arboris TaxID=84035 RepID=A0A1H7BY64_9FIRM|nr:hypothetical protein [Propionispira arboris]SEJ82136.1 hypothetical protein SAMN05660742_11855 [Propionispira arboris]
MRKILLFVVVLVLLISLIGTALAASSLDDVPANHWAYTAIRDLAKAKVIDINLDESPESNKLMSRYECAVLVAKAMQNMDKANDAQKIIINSLKMEFDPEIKDINMSVTKKEKNYPIVKIGGDIRYRFYSNLGGTGTNKGGKSTSVSQDRFRIGMTAQLDERWTVNARIGSQFVSNRTNYGSTSGSNGSSSGETQMDQAELVYQMDPNWSATVGRSSMFLGTTGAISDCTSWDGFTLKYSDNKFTGRFLAYDISQALQGYVQMTTTTNTKTDAQNIKGLDLVYKFNPKITVTADYLISDNQKTNTSNNSLPWNILAVGAKVKIAPDYTLKTEVISNRASHATSVAPKEGNGFYTGLFYKETNSNKPGTYSIGVHYQAFGKDAINNMLMGGLTTSNNTYGVKGWGVSYDYIITKNFQANLKCDWVTPYDTSVNNFKYKPQIVGVFLAKF